MFPLNVVLLNGAAIPASKAWSTTDWMCRKAQGCENLYDKTGIRRYNFWHLYVLARIAELATVHLLEAID